MSPTSTQSAQQNFLRRMLTPPVFEGDANKTRTARLLHVILLALAGVILVFATLEILVTGVGMVTIFTEAMGLIYFGLWIVMRRGHVRFASIVTASMFLLSTTMLIYFTGTIRTGITAFYIVGVVMAGVLLGNRGMVIFTGLSLLALGGLLRLEMTGQLPPGTLESANIGEWLTYAGIFTVIAVLLGLSTTNLNQALARAQVNEESLSQSNRELQAIRTSLEERVADRTAQLQASVEVGRAAASLLDADQLLRQTANLITDRFAFYYAAVFIIESSGRYAVLREATGEAGQVLKERNHRLEVNGQSMVGYAITHRRPRVALDVGEDAVRFANPLLPATRSEIALPLMVGDQVLGALDVQSMQEAAFDEANAAVLQSMADQIAVALSNAEQFTETKTALQRAATLSESITALVTANSTQEVIQHLAHYANALVGADRTIVYLMDHDLKQVTAQAAAGSNIDLEKLSYEVLSSGISGQVIQSGKPVLSLSADDGIEPAETRERRTQYGTGALIVVPLLAQGRVIGTVTTSNRIDQPLFTQRDVDLLMTLAAQSVSMIEKQRLLEEVQRALSDLDAVNRRLTGETWSEHLRRRSVDGVRWIGTTQRAPGAALPEVDEALRGGQIATRLLDDRQQLGVAVPIKLRDVPVGALRLVVPKRAWNAEMAAALDSIAGHVAQASENARLISETEERLTRERALAEATERVRQRSEVEMILQTAATELARYMNASRVTVHLSSQESSLPR